MPQDEQLLILGRISRQLEKLDEAGLQWVAMRVEVLRRRKAGKNKR